MVQAINPALLAVAVVVHNRACPNLYICPHLSPVCTTFVVAHIWNNLYWILGHR